MYTYRKKINVSQGLTPFSATTINVLNLSGLGVNRIADVEIKVTLFDNINTKSSIYYYRNVQYVDPSAVPSYYSQNNSTFSYQEDNANAAYILSVSYNQSTSDINIVGFNPTGGLINSISVIDYKINFY